MKMYIKSSQSYPDDFSDKDYPKLADLVDKLDYLDGYGPSVSGYLEQMNYYLDQIDLVKLFEEDQSKIDAISKSVQDINNHLEYAVAGFYDLVNDFYKIAERQN